MMVVFESVDKRLASSGTVAFESIGKRFASTVAKNADALAISFNQATMSYAELGNRVNQLANVISQSHSPAQSAVPIVSLFIDHSADMVTAMLSTVVAGYAYQPLDTSFPDDRLEKLFNTSQPFLIITSKQYFSRISALVAVRVEVIAIDDEIEVPTKQAIAPTPDANSPAYMLSTSGTTGEPKSILHTQQSLLRGADHYLNDLAVTPQDHIALVLPCTYTPAIFCIFGALLSGASLHIFDLKKQTIEDMAAWLAQAKITLLYSSPTIFRRVMHQFADQVDLSALRSIQLAGEPVFKSDIETYQARFAQQFSLYNGMGTTETSCLTRFFIDGDTVIEDESVPIGDPYDDVEISIIDEHGQPVAQGQEGELVVKGACVARGYYQRPDLSKQNFTVPEAVGEAVIYRTGDRVKRNQKGQLLHLGRLDGQVKLRGQRVELSEVEALMLRSGLATEAVVCMNQQNDQAYLSAFYQPEGDVGLMRQYLSTKLPPFMMPTRMVSMQTLPTNASGKVDRFALRHFEFSESDTDESTRRPQDIIEARIIEAFETVLKQTNLGASSNFFDYGGDSLKAVELAIVLQQQLGVPINISVLIESPTPRLLAKKARLLLHADGANHLVRFEDEGYQANRADDAIPVFCVPGLHGDALSFRALASKLISTRRVYAIEYPGFDGSPIQFNSLESLVDICHDAIQKVYPQGPIALVCYSIGGVVGFELSRRFEVEGREVRLLAMLDCYAPKGIKLRHVRDYTQYNLKKLKDRVGHLRHNDTQSIIDARRAEVNMALGKAVFKYKEKPRNIDNMLLVVAKDQPPALGFYDNYQQWDALVLNGYQRIEVDGDHLSVIMPEKAQQMADVINQALQSHESGQQAHLDAQQLMPFLQDTWALGGSESLIVEAVAADRIKDSQRSLLDKPEQLTSRLEQHINDQIEPKVINSQQRGRFYYRKVALHSKQSQKPVAIAAIRIAMDTLPPSAVEAVVNVKEPFGKILSNNAIQYQCELAALFKANPDQTMAQAFAFDDQAKPLYGRSNQFRNLSGQVVADVVEILAPWV